MHRMTGAFLLSHFYVSTSLKAQRPAGTQESASLELWPEKELDMATLKAVTPADQEYLQLPGSWLHHHIWKTGGTDLCNIAIKNREALPTYGLWTFGRQVGVDDACRLFLYEGESFTFAYWMRPASQYLDAYRQRKIKTSVMLRKPLNLAVSQYHHILDFTHFKFSLIEWMQLGICRAWNGQGWADPCLEELSKSMHNRGVWPGMVRETLTGLGTEADQDEFAWFEDNIQTRWISGAAAGTLFAPNTTSGLIGEEELRSAKTRLTQYTDVYILEMFDDRDKARLAARRGWNITITGNVGTHRHSNAEGELSAPEIEYMKTILEPDMKLYQFAKELASEQAQR